MCADGLAFISTLGQNVSTMSGDAREISYLFQRFVLTIQRLNAVALRDTFTTFDPSDE